MRASDPVRVASPGRGLQALGRGGSDHARCASSHVTGSFVLITAHRGPTVPRFTEPGKWYFVVDYSSCGSPVPMAEATSLNEKPDPLRYRVVSDYAVRIVAM